MNVAQNVSAIFNSPQIAEMALQAVQAGELAERQGLAALRFESERREHQVSGPEGSSALEELDPRASGGSSAAVRPAGRRGRSPAPQRPAPEPPDPDGGHRIDLMA